MTNSSNGILHIILLVLSLCAAKGVERFAQHWIESSVELRSSHHGVVLFR
jgi:hypothetical protein